MLAHFSLLGASWALFLCLAAFLVAFWRFLCVLGRLELDFGGFWVAQGRVLEGPGLDFSRFLNACTRFMGKITDTRFV